VVGCVSMSVCLAVFGCIGSDLAMFGCVCVCVCLAALAFVWVLFGCICPDLTVFGRLWLCLASLSRSVCFSVVSVLRLCINNNVFLVVWFVKVYIILMMYSGSFADEDVAEAVRKGEPNSSQSLAGLLKVGCFRFCPATT